VGIELVYDLPWTELSLMGIGSNQVEVELVDGGLGEELGTAVEGFQIVKLAGGADIALYVSDRYEAKTSHGLGRGNGDEETFATPRKPLV
jgi:hypothetical protein